MDLCFATGRQLGWLTIACFIIGCGSGSQENPNWPKRYPASGSVTYQGKPIEGALVTFMSNDGKSSATGQTGADGKFHLTTFVDRDGAVAGDQVVTVYCAKVVDNTPKDVDLSAGGKALPPTTTWIVPEKYSHANKSGLTAKVTEQGPNEFALDLK